MRLTRGDIGNLISALDVAIEYRVIEIDSELPPRTKDYTPEDMANAGEWALDIEIFQSLRKRLGKIEKSWRRAKGRG